MSLMPVVDWSLAARVGGSVIKAETYPDTAELAGVVEELHCAAERAIALVAAASHLESRATPGVYALSRRSWIDANAQLSQALCERIESPPTLTLATKVGRRAQAVILGVALAAMSSRILGQYDPHHERLLLVVPNLVNLERTHGFVSQDFRLWACLHEQTHAVQFGAAPWLLDHLVGLVEQVAGDQSSLWLQAVKKSAVPAVKPLGQIMAVMSLLEGHADVMMDEAGREIIPTWYHLRSVFTSVRQQRSPGLLERFGIVGKDQQYLTGAAFCREVIDSAGIEVLNRVFSEPQALPSQEEISAPRQWLRRIDG